MYSEKSDSLSLLAPRFLFRPVGDAMARYQISNQFAEVTRFGKKKVDCFPLLGLSDPLFEAPQRAYMGIAIWLGPACCETPESGLYHI
jgi:hypothetical protein